MLMSSYDDSHFHAYTMHTYYNYLWLTLPAPSLSHNSNTPIPSYVVDHTCKSHTRLANLYWRFNYVQKTKWYPDMYLIIYTPIKHLSASQMFNLQYKQINMQVIHHISVHDNSYVSKVTYVTDNFNVVVFLFFFTNYILPISIKSILTVLFLDYWSHGRFWWTLLLWQVIGPAVVPGGYSELTSTYSVGEPSNALAAESDLWGN